MQKQARATYDQQGELELHEPGFDATPAEKSCMGDKKQGILQFEDVFDEYAQKSRIPLLRW